MTISAAHIDSITAVINPIPSNNANNGGARGSVTLKTGFQRASAEQGPCTLITLTHCEGETAKNELGLNIDGVQLCFEPQRRAELRQTF